MNGVKDNLCRTLSLLSLDARVKALRLAFEGSTRPRAAAETLGLDESQASRFYRELEEVGLVRKQRIGKTLDIVADGDGVLRFLRDLGDAIYPGGVFIRVVVYGDELPEPEPIGVEGIVPPDPFIDGWERELDREIQQQLDEEDPH